MGAILTLFILIGAFYCFWLFAHTATPRQMGQFLIVTGIAISVLTLFFLALTHRLPFALALLMAALPVMAAKLDQRRRDIMVDDIDPDALDGVFETVDPEVDDEPPPKPKKIIRIKDDFQKSA